MARIIEYVIDEISQGLSIEKFLRKKRYTAKSIVRLKKTKEGIMINDEWEYMNYVLNINDVLKIRIEEHESSLNIPAVYHRIHIVFEDEDLIILSKDKDMPTHPSMNNYENTLANALMYYMKAKEENFVFRCINRLDKNTTGLTIVAKNYVSAGILYEQMGKREISGTYIAIVKALPDTKINLKVEGNGKIDYPIAREEASCIKRCVDIGSGERAVTNYYVLEHIADYYLIEFQLETGRTHQIRVHMSYIGYPLIGDELYGGELRYIQRTALHSTRLYFNQAISNERITIEDKMPEDMLNAWEGIKSFQ